MIDFDTTDVSPTAGPFCTRAKVPGKVIISGEHAVVYGAQAIACAIQKYAFAKVSSNNFLGVHLIVSAFGIDQQFTPLQLLALSQKTQLSHQQYTLGLSSLSDVVSGPDTFFAAAIGASGLVDVLPNDTGLHIELTTNLATGGGMGSSAALVAAMLAASFKHLGQPLSAAELVLKTTQSEHWQHGRSSGLDPYVCVMGGLQQYQYGKALKSASHTPQASQLPPCFLISSGKPESSTGDCVEFVKQQNFPKSMWQKFNTVQVNLLTALQENQQDKLLCAIRANHQLLCDIGVVPKQVNEFIANIEGHKGAAKICGAGSVVGDAAGLVLVTGLEQNILANLCANQGYEMQVMQPDLLGVAYDD